MRRGSLRARASTASGRSAPSSSAPGASGVGAGRGEYLPSPGSSRVSGWRCAHPVDTPAGGSAAPRCAERAAAGAGRWTFHESACPSCGDVCCGEIGEGGGGQSSTGTRAKFARSRSKRTRAAAKQGNPEGTLPPAQRCTMGFAALHLSEFSGFAAARSRFVRNRAQRLRALGRGGGGT